ncbi:hypothetical protein [Kitasatospora acidiphila]|uniref:hypothetical protein n=1 Tax=Kitasatospora acidiphila TaxID=2567942 RepID=UPI001E31DACC|nr:hypothetical protein [Kitasatospora acidiphila]
MVGPPGRSLDEPRTEPCPALVSGHPGHLWAYLVGPLLGALLAVPLAWLLRGAPSSAAALAARGGADDGSRTLIPVAPSGKEAR